MGDTFQASGHIDDMTNLPELSENSILKNLQARYEQEIIYTYTGTILVACNPYKWLTIYEDEYVKKYAQVRFGELSPHIFAIAEASYSHMKATTENQSVIISGESGAGKTESTKLILQYLTAVTTNQMWIEQQIMEASTILESFGNAKTVRNNNSSRFGKFMQVQFNHQKHICGASIINYLLEKSRVVQQAPEERNYHCFYQLVLGCSDEERTKFKLIAPEKFRYLNQSGCIKFETIDDKKDYEALKLALTVMNLSPEDIDRLFKLLSAILHIGNIDFTAGEDNCKVSNPDTVKTISDLLECDNAKLAEAFTFRSIVVRGEMSKIPLNSSAAKDNRDSVSKALYSRLFDWIVAYINESIKPTEASLCFIGVLDIFGFELFKVNSFEQLCINFANEKLQQFFTNYIFKLEQIEYEKENISWDKIDFVDNADCIEMFENKLGVFALLDEETRFPKGTDETFLAKLNDKYEKHKYYIKPRQAKGLFGVKHYAGEVSYEIKGFLDKNKDEASELMFMALATSNIPLVKSLVEVKTDDDDKSGKKTMSKRATVAGNFRQQLLSLVTTLGATNPQYVRCVKPNSIKKSFVFEEELVLAQLRYSGMLETIRIRKAGYSVRVPFDQFMEKFKMLIPRVEGSSHRDQVDYLLKKLQIDSKHWQIGKTKIFMRQTVFQPLQDAKEKFLSEKAVQVSKMVVGNYYRQIFIRKRKAMVIIQKYVRMFLARNRYNGQRKATIVIQSVIRGWFARDFARMLRQQKKEAEEQARREAEEAEERRKQEEAARRSREASEAAAAEEKRRKEREEAERLRRLQEEQEILELTRQAQQVKVKMAKAETKVAIDDLGDMFSFLDVVDDEFVSKDDKNKAIDRMMHDLTSQIDDIYNIEADDYKKTINKKKNKKLDTSSSAAGISVDAPAAAPGAPAPAPAAPAAPGAPPGPPGSAIPDAPPLPSGDIYQNIKKRPGRGPPAAMKSNPLQRKMEQEATAAAAKPEQTKEETDDSLENFAAKHFEEHDKSSGTIGTLRKKKKYTIKEMLHYTKNPIPVSMLKFNVPDDPRREKMITVAVEIFREILKITDPIPKKEDNVVPMIQNVVKLGIGVPELRDEILVQLVRQTSESPKDVKNWDIICVKGWQMILICLSSFPPSKSFARYLKGYIRRTAALDPNAVEEEKEKEKDDEDSTLPTEEESLQDKQKKRQQLKVEIIKYSKLCDEAFQQIILNGARKLPPSAVEIEAMKTARPIICRFYFLDGNVKAIGISSSTTAAQAIKDLSKRIDLPDTAGWSIYEVYPDSEYVVKGSDVIADILARWELEKRNSATETKYQTMKKGTQVTSVAVGGGEARFFLKKRLFRTPQKIPTDPVEYHLIYAQAVASVLRGDFPLTEQAALRLCALKCQVDWGDFDPEQKSRLNELNNYLPTRFQAIKPKEEWINEICTIHAKLVGKSLLQAKVLYLEAVKQFPLYGASLYPATYKGFWAHSSNLLIAVHVEGLAWVHPKTKAIMKSYKYDQIDSWELDVGTVIFNVKPEEDAADAELTRLEFETKQNDEVVSLIKDYSPAHRVGKTKQEKAAEISAEELSGLASDIEKTRNKLLEARIMRLPGPAAGTGSGTTKFKTMSLVKNTLKMGTLTKDKSKRQSTAIGGGDMQAGSYDYTLADWSFSKTRLSFSLSEMDLTLDADLHENALRMNTCLLAYAGLVQAPAFPEDENPRAPMSFMIQDFIRGCLEVPRARDELYLQLIRMTTSHPEPDSNTVIKLWKLLCIVAWVFLPSQVILEYLRAHLRAAAYGNSPSLARRKREREFARFALKAVHRTQLNGSRKQPPSADEIGAVILMKPMFARFHFMDNQSRALTFDPATTTTEILDMVKEKIGVKNCTGFALFESFGSLERSMTGKEKIADTIFKWDKFAKQTNSDKSLRLVFKRRIFMPPLDQFSNEFERDLVMHQAIFDVANDRYPVTEEEAAFLAGLRSQIELGDTGTYKPDEPIYTDIVKRYLPKHYVKAGAPALVASAHSKLKGKSKDDCKKLYMDHILSWELYGSTIFNVLQSYTTAMPNNLWLAVNHSGVHILNRRSKTPLLSYPYKSIVNYSPSHKNIMIMTESLTRGTKYVFNTSEASQIAHLIKDYTDVIIATRKKEAQVPAKKDPKAAPPKK